MNLSRCSVVLRPRTVAEMLDLTCRLTFTETGWNNVKLGLVVLLPAFAATVAAYYFVTLHWAWFWLAALVFAGFLEAPFTLTLSRFLFGDHLTIGQSLKLALKRFWAFSIATIVKVLAIALSGVFLIGPFITWPNGLLINEAVLLEGASGTESWSRSKRLVQQGASGFGAAAGIVFARLTFVLGGEALGQALVSEVLQMGKPVGELFDQGVTPFALLGLFLSVPFCATMRFLYYIDTRTRADGWDIQVKLMAIQAKSRGEEALA